MWAFAAFCSGRCSAFQHLWTPGSWHPWHDNCTVLSVKSFFWAGSFIAGTRLLPLPRRFLPVSVGLGSNSPWIGWYWQKNAMGGSVGQSLLAQCFLWSARFSPERPCFNRNGHLKNTLTRGMSIFPIFRQTTKLTNDNWTHHNTQFKQ